MKKSLVALAALAFVGAASAQSSVTISGIVKGGLAGTKQSGAGTGSQIAINDGSSQFWLLGTEDLGGGLKGVFKIDTRFRVDESTAASQASGNTFVGLTGNFGGIQIGKRDTHYCLGSDTHGSRATALQASSCGILGYVGTQARSIANASRSTNVIRYDLPNLNGLNGYLGYSSAPFGADGVPGGTSRGNAYFGQLTYANGPISLGASAWRGRSEDRTFGATRADQDAWTVTGGYNFGFLTVGLTYDRSKYEVGTVGGASPELRRSAWSVPLTAPLGAGTVLFTFTRAGGVSNVADSGAKLWSLGYDYALSKRTSVGVSYAYLDNKAGAAYQLYTQSALAAPLSGAAGVDYKQLYLGVRHAF